MPGLLPNIDPDGLLEFSVVYTDNSVVCIIHSISLIARVISAVF